MVIAYLPVLYQAFNRREVGVLLLDARAGSPPSGPELLHRMGSAATTSSLPELFAEWERWAADVKQATGIKGKALFQPLRLALTAREHGPELKLLLPLVGRERALARLEGQTA